MSGLHGSARDQRGDFRMRVDLHVVARRITAVGLLHHPGLAISAAHPSALWVFAPTFFGQLLKFLNCLLQPLLSLALRSLACLGGPPARFLFAHLFHRRHLFRRLLERLLHSLFSTKTV